MKGTAAAAMLVAISVAAEIALPGRTLYHAGWFNVAIAALTLVAFAMGRRAFRHARYSRARVAISGVILGTAVLGLAGVSSGLLAPDNQMVIGAPGSRVRVEALGLLVFPIVSTSIPNDVGVALERGSGSAMEIGERSRDAGNFIVRTIPRNVVYIDARDLHGNALTVTQPSGATFLSPVLLMEHRQTIAGMDLPFDSFNVPAAQRVVKAVMFDANQSAMLLHGGAQLGAPAVLFAVDDEHERPLAHSIALSAAGRPVLAGDLRLSGVIATYPGVEVVAAPNIFAVVLGALLVLVGIATSVTPQHVRH